MPRRGFNDRFARLPREVLRPCRRSPPSSARAQWAPQNQWPSTSTPWPMICTRQCSQMGAIRWIAQEKQSKTCTAPWAWTSKVMP
ncbi:hypothetical protein ACFQ2H_30560 [Streptomyces violaceoruber]